MEPGPCLTTSLPVAPARTTLAEAHHRPDQSGVGSVVVRMRARNDAPARAVGRAPAQRGALVGADRAVMTGDLPRRVRAAVNVGQTPAVIAAPIGARTADRVAGPIERGSGVA